jgi:hypothetical protein
MEPHESDRYKKFAQRVYKKLVGNRAYALNPAALEGLAAFCKSWHDAGGELSDSKPYQLAESGEEAFGKVLTELGQFSPGLFQPKPDGALEPPKIPVDPVSGQPLPNPWATNNLAAQSFVQKTDPELATYFKQAASDPWKWAIAWRDKESKREHRAAITYTADDHARNPFVTGGLTEQSEFLKRDPIRAEIFKREAEPVKLPFTPGSVNETVRGQLYVKNPRLYQWCENSRATCEQWNAERLAALKAAEQQARVEREALEKQLRREEAKTSRQPGELV